VVDLDALHLKFGRGFEVLAIWDVYMPAFVIL
jgi:hypothetical protein